MHTKTMEPKTFTSTKKEIFDSYLTYFKAYTTRNWDAMLETFHPEITVVGTGIDELKLTTKEVIEFYKREFEQAPEVMKCDITKVHVQKISTDSALIIMTCNMRFGNNKYNYFVPNNRTTAIMKQSGGVWKLLNGHWSQPSECQDVGESIPYKTLQQENKTLEQIVVARTEEIQTQNRKLEKIIKTKNQLFSIIAHDLRSPFNSFMGLSEIMLLNFNKNYQKKEYFKTRLTIINQQARHLYTIADNLLNWAKSQLNETRINITHCNVANIIENQISVLNELHRSKRIIIEKDLLPELTFNSDPEIINIVLRNILSNAIKYS